MVGSYPGGFLARFLFPLVAERVYREKDRHFLLGKLVPVYAGISFGNAMTIEYHGNVFACWAFVHVCCYAIAIWIALIGRLPQNRVGLFLGIAESRDGLITQAIIIAATITETSFITGPFDLLDFECTGRISRVLRNNQEALSI